MDKFNFIREGGSKLPPGFRFQPTEEEIVFQYLTRKIFSCPLPATVIPEIDNIFSFHPWELPGDSEQDKYFFSYKEPNCRNDKNRSSRAVTCSGYWRVTGFDKQISCSKRMPIVGIKSSLVFYKVKNSCATRTDWFMHLYCVSVPRNPTCRIIQHKRHSSQGCLVQIGKWDLCHIFLKKMSSKAEVYDNCTRLGNYENLMMVEESDAADSCASSSSYSDSSARSEVSSISVNSDCETK